MEDFFLSFIEIHNNDKTVKYRKQVKVIVQIM